MRILELTPRLPWPLTDGGAVGIFKAVEATAAQGHEITLVSYPERDRLVTTEGLEQLSKFCTVRLVQAPLPSRNVTLLKTLLKGAYPVERRMVPSMFKLLRELLDSNAFDLVHVDHAHMGKYAVWIKENYGLPYVLREHNYESLIYKRFAAVQKNPAIKALTAMHGRRLMVEETRFIEEAACVIPITPQDEVLMRVRTPDQMYRVIPAGVDIEYFKPVAEGDSKTILWVGGMGWDPNKDAISFFLSEIFPLILDQAPNATFVMVGEGTERVAVPIELKGKVIARGRVPDIRPFLADAAVLAVPLRVGGGMRLKILDFLAAGKAIVSTSIGAEGNHAADGEHMLLRDTAEDFANAAVQLLHNPGMRIQLGKNGRKLVEERYSWPSIGRSFSEVYHEVAAL